MLREEPMKRFAERTRIPLRIVAGKLLASLDCLRDHWDRIDERATPAADRATHRRAARRAVCTDGRHAMGRRLRVAFPNHE
jgi:hypothetical protein